MNIIKKYNYILLGYLLFVFTLYSANLIFKFESMWGFNHLLFIEKPLVYLFTVPFIVILICTSFSKDIFWNNIIDKIFYNWIFVNRIIFFLLLIIFLLFLYFFKIETYFLGDGYSWIANFSYPDYYIVKPTELLSSHLIRSIQYVLGGFTKETSLLAFQIVSILSGVIFFFNLKNILDLLLTDNRLKVFAFLSFFFSGLVLLFMGYVEFYPMLWMTVSFYLYFSLKSFNSSKYVVWSVLLFIIMILIHAQAVYLSFGFLYLLIWRKFDIAKIKRRLKKHPAPILFISILLSVGIIIIMYQNNKITQILLPLFSSNPEHLDYYLFSISHFLDIFNLIILLFPSLLVFSFLIGISFRKLTIDSLGLFFIFSSIGSLLFLLFVNPYIGFARDWDLMSMTLFLPVLLTFYFFDTIKIRLNGKTIFIALALLVTLSSSYLYVSVSKEKSLKRFESILKINKGIQFLPGWTILINCLNENNYTDKLNYVQNEMNQRFSEYLECEKAYNYLKQGKIKESLSISTSLINKYPNDISFIHLRGSIFTMIQKYDSAQYYLDKGLSIQSTYPSILKVYGQLLIRKGDLNNAIDKLEKANFVTHGRSDIVELLASCYIRTGRLDKAKEFANKFYEKDIHSSSYHLILMQLHTRTKEKDKARYHYEEFLKYGKSRSDYSSVMNGNSFLLNKN